MYRRIYLLWLFIALIWLCLFSVFAEGTADVGLTAKITADRLHLRVEPSTSSSSLGMLLEGEEVVLLEFGDTWSKVASKRLGEGWVASCYFQIMAAKEVSGDKLVFELDILSYACRFLGVPYHYGGSSPQGFDCSGFTAFVFRYFGYDLPRSSIAQASIGTEIIREELIPGDLLFFRTLDSARINHVGLYLGDGRFIHASSGRGHVIISPLNKGYYNQRFVKAIRIITNQPVGE
jgi:hypothetical protein